eukprot:SM000302S11669  [mRNA]  locus=s302:60289:67966:- [translate_table: standard]
MVRLMLRPCSGSSVPVRVSVSPRKQLSFAPAAPGQPTALSTDDGDGGHSKSGEKRKAAADPGDAVAVECVRHVKSRSREASAAAAAVASPRCFMDASPCAASTAVTTMPAGGSGARAAPAAALNVEAAARTKSEMIKVYLRVRPAQVGQPKPAGTDKLPERERDVGSGIRRGAAHILSTLASIALRMPPPGQPVTRAPQEPEKGARIGTPLSSAAAQLEVEPVAPPVATCVDALPPHDVRVRLPASWLEGGRRPQVETYTDFARVFGPTAGQDEVFAEVLAPHVRALLLGDESSTVMAYGMTASGKTHTIMGDLEQRQPGLLPRAMSMIFEHLSLNLADCPASAGTTPSMSQARTYISMFEIYSEGRGKSERIFDLLDGSQDKRQAKALALRDDREQQQLRVNGLHEEGVTSAAMAIEVLRAGNAKRETHGTKTNAESSRSHCVVIIRLSPTNAELLSCRDLCGMTARRGQLTILDLAGFERDSDTAKGARKDESSFINNTFLQLGKCYREWMEHQMHSKKRLVQSYRDSKITHLLKYPLMGQGQMSLMVNISPCEADYRQTLGVLRDAKIFCGLRTKIIPGPSVLFISPKPKKKHLATPATARHIAFKSERQLLAIQKENDCLQEEVRQLKRIIFSMERQSAERAMEHHNEMTRAVEDVNHIIVLGTSSDQMTKQKLEEIELSKQSLLRAVQVHGGEGNQQLSVASIPSKAAENSRRPSKSSISTFSQATLSGGLWDEKHAVNSDRGTRESENEEQVNGYLHDGRRSNDRKGSQLQREQRVPMQLLPGKSTVSAEGYTSFHPQEENEVESSTRSELHICQKSSPMYCKDGLGVVGKECSCHDKRSQEAPTSNTMETLQKERRRYEEELTQEQANSAMQIETYRQQVMSQAKLLEDLREKLASRCHCGEPDGLRSEVSHERDDYRDDLAMIMLQLEDLFGRCDTGSADHTQTSAAMVNEIQSLILRARERRTAGVGESQPAVQSPSARELPQIDLINDSRLKGHDKLELEIVESPSELGRQGGLSKTVAAVHDSTRTLPTCEVLRIRDQSCGHSHEEAAVHLSANDQVLPERASARIGVANGHQSSPVLPFCNTVNEPLQAMVASEHVGRGQVKKPLHTDRISGTPTSIAQPDDGNGSILHQAPSMSRGSEPLIVDLVAAGRHASAQRKDGLGQPSTREHVCHQQVLVNDKDEILQATGPMGKYLEGLLGVTVDNMRRSIEGDPQALADELTKYGPMLDIGSLNVPSNRAHAVRYCLAVCSGKARDVAHKKASWVRLPRAPDDVLVQLRTFKAIVQAKSLALAAEIAKEGLSHLGLAASRKKHTDRDIECQQSQKDCAQLKASVRLGVAAQLEQPACQQTPIPLGLPALLPPDDAAVSPRQPGQTGDWGTQPASELRWPLQIPVVPQTGAGASARATETAEQHSEQSTAWKANFAAQSGTQPSDMEESEGPKHDGRRQPLAAADKDDQLKDRPKSTNAFSNCTCCLLAVGLACKHSIPSEASRSTTLVQPHLSGRRLQPKLLNQTVALGISKEKTATSSNEPSFQAWSSARRKGGTCPRVAADTPSLAQLLVGQTPRLPRI